MSTSKGNATISFVFKVSAEKAPAVEKGLANHAEWMRETHAIGSGKSVNLVDYYVTKAEEYVNPANPEEGKTGNIIIIMNEVYPNPEEIGNHMNEAQKWSGMGGLLQLFKDYDATLLMGGEIIQTL